LRRIKNFDGDSLESLTFIREWQISKVNSVRGDLLRKLLLIISYHFVRNDKSEQIRDAYSTKDISGEPRVDSSDWFTSAKEDIYPDLQYVQVRVGKVC
jgi:hypothetical protein